MPKNVKDWGKLIVAKGFKKLPKVQKIANSGHTGFATEMIKCHLSDVSSGQSYKDSMLVNYNYRLVNISN